MESLFAPCFNLVLLVGILVVKLRAPLRDFVSQRHESIASEIQAVREQLRKAQAQFVEFSDKLKAVDSEIAAMREQVRQDSAAMKDKVVSEASRMAGVVEADAKRSASGLYSELKGQLYSELCIRVLDRAESLLKDRVTGDDRVRIQREFSQQLESLR